MSKKNEENTNTKISRFGSHSSMKSEELTNLLKDKNLVILQDDDGFYATKKDRLDTNASDPFRWTTCEYKVNWLKELFPEAKIWCSDDKVNLELNNAS